MSPDASFEIAPGLRLSVTGNAADVRHFELEYGPCRSTGRGQVHQAPAGLDVAFGLPRGGGGSTGPRPRVTGSHKTVGWAIEVSPADDRPVEVTVGLRGFPRAFARSLVQGYYVEPLLSVVAAEAGYVVLPAAGIVGDAGLDILIGRSRAGKSTLAARALASGRHVIGDDQVIVDTTGEWRPFPRRLRFYPDLRVTAPGAFGVLSPGTRARLTQRRLMAALSGGFVRPSLAVDPGELGRHWNPAPVPAARILLLDRSLEASEVQVEPVGHQHAVDRAAEVLAEQRSRLVGLADAGWASRLAGVADTERALLASAIAGVPVHEVRIPGRWEAARAIEATARALGLES